MKFKKKKGKSIRNQVFKQFDIFTFLNLKYEFFWLKEKRDVVHKLHPHTSFTKKKRLNN